MKYKKVNDKKIRGPVQEIQHPNINKKSCKKWRTHTHTHNKNINHEHEFPLEGSTEGSVSWIKSKSLPKHIILKFQNTWDKRISKEIKISHL